MCRWTRAYDGVPIEETVEKEPSRTALRPTQMCSFGEPYQRAAPHEEAPRSRLNRPPGNTGSQNPERGFGARVLPCQIQYNENLDPLVLKRTSLWTKKPYTANAKNDVQIAVARA